MPSGSRSRSSSTLRPARPGVSSRDPVASDETLIARIREGDLEAFGELVGRHQDVVFRVSARLVGPEEAHDVAQDAFLRAFHRLEQFRGEAPFRSWLLQIAHNAAVNALASRRPRPIETAGEEGSTGERDAEGGSAGGPAEALEASERRERLQAKLGLMRPTHRTVLVLRDIEGMSYREIAEVTDSPLGSVKGRLHRAREELIELLRANTYDWELPR